MKSVLRSLAQSLAPAKRRVTACMAVVSLALLAALAGRLGAASTELQPARDFGCTEWHDCRLMALAAAARGDYETFHDLAWRAVQTGPPKDPALMFLLARAQALSGRPHDALIMLQRLAEMGVPSDIAADDEFVHTRQLPGWPEVSALIERLTHPDSPPLASSAAVTSSPSAKLPPPSSTSPLSSPATATSSSAPGPSSSVVSPSSSFGLSANVARFSTESFTLGGLAYDPVSRRFLVGDRLGRKLMVVADGANHAVDFVRAASAGFRDIAAIEIDDRRGDLWVVSAATPADGVATLHKLQLVSGRPLKSFPIAAGLEPVTIADLAVTPAGAVLVLDSAEGRLLALQPGRTAAEAVMKIESVEPVSVAAGSEPGIVYVAHRDGVSRIDLHARTATRVTAPASISLAHLSQIRWRRHALFGIRGEPDGTHRIIRFDLSTNGRAVTRSTILEGPTPLAGQTFVAISGDELVYIVDSSKDAVGRPHQGVSGTADFVAYRVPLR
jgi:hypothetical protein